MAEQIAYNMDCMEYMKTLPDKAFGLAVVDPPYGINYSQIVQGNYQKKNWDSKVPEKKYFDELFRVSKNQIIWGGNYFGLRGSRCWLVWDKVKGNIGFADCELAWTSFSSSVRKFVFRWHGVFQGNMKNRETRIHPTQKPVQLYEWIYRNYAKPGMRILDTHLGSGSSRIAAREFDLDFVGCELDADYFAMQEERWKNFCAQGTLF